MVCVLPCNNLPHLWVQLLAEAQLSTMPAWGRMWCPRMLRAGCTLRAHLLLLRPRCLGQCPALLALHLRFGGDALPLRSDTLRSSGRLRGSFGQGLFLCWHRGLLFCCWWGLLLRWGRARGLALLSSPEAPGRRGLLLGGCCRLGGRGCRRGRSLLLAGGGRLVPRGAGGWRLWSRQWHRGRVAEAAFKQPLSLAVQAQPFVLLQKNGRKSPVEILGASSQQESQGGALLMGHVATVQRTRPTH